MSIDANLPAISILSGTTETRSSTASIPWYIWAGVVAATDLGGAWDVAWHRSIGRDSFWTPAHMAMYACSIIAGIVSVWLIVRCTFGGDTELRRSSVQVFRLRAPLGAFITGWGGAVMLVSASFDNWWHSAYGLDLTLISPPHILIMFGSRMISAGMLFLVLAAMNRAFEAGAANSRHLQMLFLYLCGLILAFQMFSLQEPTLDFMLHQAAAYIAMAIFLPVVFAASFQASRFSWAATCTAAIYSLLTIAEILIFPLFPAHPRLGPVYYPVTHLVPAKFPILIFVPALALDLLWQRTCIWKPWQTAIASGIVFIAVLTAVEWPFASFLMSRASENRFFGTIYFQYNAQPDGFDRLRKFASPDHGLALFLGLLRATLYASLSVWIGLGFGRWLRRVRR
jgi:hypothetical protein